MNIKYVLSINSTKIQGYEGNEGAVTKSYTSLDSARKSFRDNCKRLPGQLVFEQKGDFYTTLIIKRTYRDNFNAISIKLEKKIDF